MKQIDVQGTALANDQPLLVFGGLNVLESAALADEVAQQFVEVCSGLGLAYVFKASFDKANRSSLNSFRGPGLEQGLQMLADIKSRYGVPIITDVHEPAQAAAVAEVADVLQLPAFLSRQTDLVQALAETGKPVNIKKAQFLSAPEMQHIIGKCVEAGNEQIILCERGTMFGYNNLVVDMLSFSQLKAFSRPVIFDVTHSLQMPGGRADSAGGRRAQVFELAKAGISQGLAGLFLEAHPNPDEAKCDGPCALPLDKLAAFLGPLQALDSLVKGFDSPQID